MQPFRFALAWPLWLVLACAGKDDGDAPSPAEKLAEEGRRLVAKGDEPEGAAKLEEAAKLSPQDPDIQLELCKAWRAADRAPNALPACKRATELGPENADAHFLHGATAFQLEHRDRAVEALRTAVGLDPKHAAAHHELSQALLAGSPTAEQRKSALDAARQAVSLVPDEVLYQVGLTKALIHNAACDEASEQIAAIEDEAEVGKLRALHYEQCGN